MPETPNEINLFAAGGPAFPVSIPGCGDNGWHGMLLRDWFAGQALLGILAGPASRDAVPMKEWFDAPEIAYRLADAMLKARAALTAGERRDG